MPPPTEAEIAARQAWAVDALDRRRGILERLTDRAREPLDWLAVRRQAATFRVLAQEAPRNRMSERVQEAFDRHIAAMQAMEDRAAKELAAADPGALSEASGRLGLRLALIGKGGAGKTVLSSTLARTLA